MKKRFAYAALLVLFIAASAFVLTRVNVHNKKIESICTELLPRKTSLTYAAEWTTVKNNVDILTGKIEINPSDIKSLLALTAQYIQEGRNTGNFDYYNKAALKCINSVLEKDPNNF